ncbi:hypothetical protein [Guptibacillus hwajinpoensis]|nr:hypothetical protein [Alkalihalobacillus macyae]
MNHSQIIFVTTQITIAMDIAEEYCIWISTPPVVIDLSIILIKV